MILFSIWIGSKISLNPISWHPWISYIKLVWMFFFSFRSPLQGESNSIKLTLLKYMTRAQLLAPHSPPMSWRLSINSKPGARLLFACINKPLPTNSYKSQSREGGGKKPAQVEKWTPRRRRSIGFIEMNVTKVQNVAIYF